MCNSKRMVLHIKKGTPFVEKVWEEQERVLLLEKFKQWTVLKKSWFKGAFEKEKGKKGKQIFLPAKEEDLSSMWWEMEREVLFYFNFCRSWNRGGCLTWVTNHSQQNHSKNNNSHGVATELSTGFFFFFLKHWIWMLLVCAERMEEIREDFEATKELWLKREKESHCIEDTENTEGILHTLSLYS